MRKKLTWPVGMTSAYLAGAIFIWISFIRTNHDGLANVGLVICVFPVTIAGLIVGKVLGVRDFLLIPHRFGYITDHAVFFFPSVLVTAGLVFWFFRWLEHPKTAHRDHA